jgi:hypothetical protein
MDWFDRHVLQYVLWWAPFGKPPEEDVFPKFGMDTCQLAGRFADVVEALKSHERQLDGADADLLARARSHPLAGSHPPVSAGLNPRPFQASHGT